MISCYDKSKNSIDQSKSLKILDTYTELANREMQFRLEKNCSEIFAHIQELRQIERKKKSSDSPKVMEIYLQNDEINEKTSKNEERENNLNISQSVKNGIQSLKNMSKRTYNMIKSLIWFIRFGIVLVFLNFLFNSSEDFNFGDNLIEKV